jgi:hypothetical protein
MIAPGDNQTLGKANHFPLLPGGVRAQLPGDNLSLERPALLDPANPADPLLLSFLPNGEVALSPKYQNDPIAQARVEASRIPLGLNWAKFRDARVEIFNMVERAVQTGEREAPTNIAGVQTASETFFDAIRDLRRYIEPQAEYAAAARVYVESFSYIWWVSDIVLGGR